MSLCEKLKDWFLIEDEDDDEDFDLASPRQHELEPVELVQYAVNTVMKNAKEWPDGVDLPDVLEVWISPRDYDYFGLRRASCERRIADAIVRYAESTCALLERRPSVTLRIDPLLDMGSVRARAQFSDMSAPLDHLATQPFVNPDDAANTSGNAGASGCPGAGAAADGYAGAGGYAGAAADGYAGAGGYAGGAASGYTSGSASGYASAGGYANRSMPADAGVRVGGATGLAGMPANPVRTQIMSRPAGSPAPASASAGARASMLAGTYSPPIRYNAPSAPSAPRVQIISGNPRPQAHLADALASEPQPDAACAAPANAACAPAANAACIMPPASADTSATPPASAAHEQAAAPQASATHDPTPGSAAPGCSSTSTPAFADHSRAFAHTPEFKPDWVATPPTAKLIEGDRQITVVAGDTVGCPRAGANPSIVLDESDYPFASSEQAKFTCEDGLWHLISYGRNGTSVQREGVWIDLRPHVPFELREGDRISFARAEPLAFSLL